jgi:hypothetical protein
MTHDTRDFNIVLYFFWCIQIRNGELMKKYSQCSQPNELIYVSIINLYPTNVENWMSS